MNVYSSSQKILIKQNNLSKLQHIYILYSRASKYIFFWEKITFLLFDAKSKANFKMEVC